MKKTLLITLEYPPMVGGVANYYYNLVQHLPADRIVVLDNSSNQLLTASKWVWPRWMKGFWNTYKTVRDNNIEHILVGQILPLGTIALLLFIFTGVRYTVMTHAMDLTVPFGVDGSRHKQKLMNLIVKYAYRITTVSSYTKMQLESLVQAPPNNIIMVYPCPHVNGLEEKPVTATAELQAKYPQIQGKRVLLSVGRLIQRKGFDKVIEAMKEVARKKEDVVYVIVGDGPFRPQLQQLVEHNNLQQSVIFTGKIDDIELRGWYAHCTAFIMASRELYNSDVEGFGIVYLEANSFGKPVVGGKSGGVLDVVHDGKNGYVVDPENVAMIENAINRLMDHPDVASSMGAVGKERVEQQYQWAVQAHKLEHMLGS